MYPRSRLAQVVHRLHLGLFAIVLGLPTGVWSAERPATLDRWLQQTGTYVFAVAGDSGSGKSTLANALVDMFGKNRVRTICVDDYHKLDRVGRKTAGVTALDPQATDLDRLARDLAELRKGRAIMKPVYDHSNGTFGTDEAFSPAPIIIVEGLHPFQTDALRKQIDFSIYYDPAARVKETWKMKRDVADRGHSPESVRQEIRARRPDYKKFIEPQRLAANMWIEFAWSKIDGNLPKDAKAMAVKLHQRNLRPVKHRLRLNRSGPGFVFRSERRRDGTALATLDGALPPNTLARDTSLVHRLTGTLALAAPTMALDSARVVVAKRILADIAYKAAHARRAR